MISKHILGQGWCSKHPGHGHMLAHLDAKAPMAPKPEPKPFVDPTSAPNPKP